MNKSLSESELFAFLSQGTPVQSSYISSVNFLNQSSLFTVERTKKKVIFEDCLIQDLNMHFFTFEKEVILKNCIIENSFFMSAVFYSSFTIDGCEFKKPLDFSCGDLNSSFHIKDTVFNDYVDFFDTFFDGNVEVNNSKFLKGTNLLSFKGAFKVQPKLEGNYGNLSLNLKE